MTTAITLLLWPWVAPGNCMDGSNAIVFITNIEHDNCCDDRRWPVAFRLTLFQKHRSLLLEFSAKSDRLACDEISLNFSLEKLLIFPVGESETLAAGG